MSLLLQSEGVRHLSHIKDHGYQPVVARPPPQSGIVALDFLWDFEQRATTYITNTIASRLFTTLHDLEIELVDFLNGFAFGRFPLGDMIASCSTSQTATSASSASCASSQTSTQAPFGTLPEKNTRKAQPATNENPLTIIVARCFSDFGVGPLALNPVIQRHFQLPDEVTPNIPVVTQLEVLAVFEKFGSKKSQSGASSINVQHGHERSYASSSVSSMENPEDVLSFLAESFCVPAVSHLGLLMNPASLEATQHTLRHVRKARDKLHAEALRALLNGAESNANSDFPNQSIAATPSTSHQRSNRPLLERTPKLSAFRRDSVATLLGPCIEAWSRKSPYSPSFSKLRTIVGVQVQQRLAEWRSQVAAGSTQSNSISTESTVTTSKKVRRKRKLAGSFVHSGNTAGSSADSSLNGSGVHVSPDLFASLLDIATDHAMLQVGSKKYRARQFVDEGMPVRDGLAETDTESECQSCNPAENKPDDVAAVEISTLTHDSELDRDSAVKNISNSGADSDSDSDSDSESDSESDSDSDSNSGSGSGSHGRNSGSHSGNGKPSCVGCESENVDAEFSPQGAPAATTGPESATATKNLLVDISINDENEIDLGAVSDEADSTLAHSVEKSGVQALNGNDGPQAESSAVGSKRSLTSLEFSFPTYSREISSQRLTSYLPAAIAPWAPHGRSGRALDLHAVGRWGEAAVYVAIEHGYYH